MVSIKCQIILIIPLLLNFFFILTELKNTLYPEGKVIFSFLQDIIVLNNRITNSPKLFATRGEIFL